MKDRIAVFAIMNVVDRHLQKRYIQMCIRDRSGTVFDAMVGTVTDVDVQDSEDGTHNPCFRFVDAFAQWRSVAEIFLGETFRYHHLAVSYTHLVSMALIMPRTLRLRSTHG